MKIRYNRLRKLIRETILLEAQMRDPLSVAIGTAMINHMNSDEFVKAVQQNLGGKKGDVNVAADELVTTFPQSQMFRAPLETLLQRFEGGEQQETKPQFTQKKPEGGPAPEQRKTMAPPPQRM